MHNGTQAEPDRFSRVGELGSELRVVGSESQLAVDGITIRYWHAGAGDKTLVFVHGNSAAKEVFFEQFSYFADRGWSLIAIDLPGHGRSDNAFEPQRQYTIPGYAEIANELLEQLNVRDYVLVGWSLGGNIALEMAGRDFSLRGMLIMGAPPVGPGADNFDKAYLPTTFDSAASKGDSSDDEMTVFAKSIYSELDTIPEHFLKSARLTDGLARETMVSHWLSGSNGCDQRTTANNWTKPICVVQGSQEPFVSLPYLNEIAWKHLWQDKVHILDHSAHAPFLENPQAFNALLESFATSVY